MKLWGGRFSASPDEFAFQYNQSLLFDQRLAQEDVHGSIAWAQGLEKAGVLTGKETAQIVQGLRAILTDIQAGDFQPDANDEDIHTAIERILTERIGEAGGKLHTGRSRNDQVATDTRLWQMGMIDQVDLLLKNVQGALIQRAEQDMGIIFPGYTHLQRAQPILLSHWWLSHFWPLNDDRQRFRQLRQRTSVLPLGSGALAGAPFPVNRAFLAGQLGFDQVSPNSLDGVSNRDFIAEFLFGAALVGTHLSRLAETLIIFSTAEFGFIELSDAYSTGSSLMPQKKNPDPLELTRGKTGTIIGRLAGFLTTLKGLPSVYDKDLQEDKQPLFETADTLCLMLPVVSGLLSSLQVKPERMQAALDPAMLATDLADYLVERGIPFRQAHSIAGQCVRRANELSLPINALPIVEFQAIHEIFKEDVVNVFNFAASVARRSVEGGTAPQAVKEQLVSAMKAYELIF
jgi:argininosuccinate lyase